MIAACRTLITGKGGIRLLVSVPNLLSRPVTTRTLEGTVVVVTGASSGIGRATAVAFARAGASLVLSARRSGLLEHVAEECRGAGGAADVAAGDVTDPGHAEALAGRAIERFGTLDAWVNNAAVSLFTHLGEEPAEFDQRVVEVNLLGYLYGARACLPWFRERGRGVLVNVGSILSVLPASRLVAYTATKFAIRGMSRSLRLEVRDAPGIHVCAVLPGAVDTPLFTHAANLSGVNVVAPRLLLPPERVARAIVTVVRRPRPEVTVGRAVHLLRLVHALAPRPVERIAAAQLERDHFGDQPADPTAGNVFAPMQAGTTASGGWRDRTAPALLAAGTLALATGTAAVLRRRGP